MDRLFTRSNLLRWAYRLALTTAAFGLLVALNIAYVDWIDGRLDRTASATALAASSSVLAVSVILGRRLRRSSKDLARRLHLLEETNHKIVKCIVSLPKDLEERTLQQTQAKIEEAMAHRTPAPISSSASPPSTQLQIALARSIELLCADGSPNGQASERITHLTFHRQLRDELTDLGQEKLAELLNDRIAGLERRTQYQLKDELVEALKSQAWTNALAIGEALVQIFSDTPMASEFEKLRPLIERKCWGQLQLEGQGKPGSRDGSPPNPEELMTSGM